jgi:polyisoprenoid-binding protein YceI
LTTRTTTPVPAGTWQVDPAHSSVEFLQGTDTDPRGHERAGAEVQGFLSRKDFDMKFNQALGSGNLLVGDKVRISLDISAILKK